MLVQDKKTLSGKVSSIPTSVEVLVEPLSFFDRKYDRVQLRLMCAMDKNPGNQVLNKLEKLLKPAEKYRLPSILDDIEYVLNTQFSS